MVTAVGQSLDFVLVGPTRFRKTVLHAFAANVGYGLQLTRVWSGVRRVAGPDPYVLDSSHVET